MLHGELPRASAEGRIADEQHTSRIWRSDLRAQGARHARSHHAAAYQLRKRRQIEGSRRPQGSGGCRYVRAPAAAEVEAETWKASTRVWITCAAPCAARFGGRARGWSATVRGAVRSQAVRLQADVFMRGTTHPSTQWEAEATCSRPGAPSMTTSILIRARSGDTCAPLCQSACSSKSSEENSAESLALAQISPAAN